MNAPPLSSRCLTLPCLHEGLVVYEYMITFGREVELFWTGRLTGAAILFFFNRYLSLVVDVYGLLENMYVPDKVSRRIDSPTPRGCWLHIAEERMLHRCEYFRHRPVRR